jgi:hypothetical protein
MGTEMIMAQISGKQSFNGKERMVQKKYKNKG